MDPILVERHGDGIVVVTLNRPAQLNALDAAQFNALGATFEALEADASVRVLVLTGAGRGFCAGADLAGSPPPDDLDGATDWMRRVHRAPIALHHLTKPTIAAVNGPAAGGGVGLVLGCDLRVAAPTATFSAPFVHMGLCPDFGVTRLLPDAVGTAVALELLYTGRKLDAPDAHRLGLISTIIDDPVAHALQLAATIATMPSSGLTRIKALVRAAAAADHDTVLHDLEPQAQAAGIVDPAFTTQVSAWRAATRTR